MAHPKAAAQSNDAKAQEPDLDQKRPKIECADQADQNQRGSGQLITAMPWPVAAYAPGLQKRKSPNVKHRTQYTAKFQNVWILAQKLNEIRHVRAPGNRPDPGVLPKIGPMVIKNVSDADEGSP